MGRIVKAEIKLKDNCIEGTEECYDLCIFLTDTLHDIGVDYMLNVDNDLLTCYLNRNAYDEGELLSLMQELLYNDLSVESYIVSVVTTEAS